MDNYKWKITLGDWSDDGHGKTKVFVIETNVSFKHIVECYKKSVEKYLDFSTYVCAEYGDSSINMEQIELFESIGMDMSYYKEEFDNEDERFWVAKEDYIDLLLMFVGLSSDEKIEYSIITDELPEFVHYASMFGYGLFW